MRARWLPYAVLVMAATFLAGCGEDLPERTVTARLTLTAEARTETDATTETPEPAATETATPADRTGCDAAYPTICLPPPPPDLNCTDIEERRFEVLAPDPHEFDRDGNGVGCESDTE